MSSQAVPELMFQNNDHIRGALLVGILRVAKAGQLSGVNNLSVSWLISQPNPTMQVYTLGPSKKYATAYMFTEETRTVYDRQNTTLQAIGEVGFVFLLGRVR